MAGNYPDVPGNRWAYDRDGTKVVVLDPLQASVVYEMTTADMERLNSEDPSEIGYLSSSFNTAVLVAVIFPELRDIVGYYANYYADWSTGTPGGVAALRTSVDTTNGIDGTWVTEDPAWTDGVPSQVGMRTIESISLTGKKAILFATGGGSGAGRNGIRKIHLFGTVPLTESPDRLVLWHPTLDQPVGPAYFDWGNVPRGSTADRTFRVKNNSASLQANDITVTMEALTDTSPTVVGQHTFSEDGLSFGAILNIGNLAPGAISNVLTVRRITPSNATLSLWWTRIVAEAASGWS